ncbi:MAG TPA: GNAT family N-acetyltransferase [Chloroflexota bacterium]|nr:GNAT family N-acetyltransferase [Chloroflexota bacterium]
MTDRPAVRVLQWPDVLAEEADWEQVRAGAPTETVFLTPDWLEPWWRHLGPRKRLSLLAVEEGAGMKALAPLYRAPIGATGLTALRPLGGGVSDYLDLLLPADGDERQTCLETLLNGLLAHPSGWDAIDLMNLPAESPTVQGLVGLCRERGLACAVLPSHARPEIELDGTWDEYVRSLPGRFRYNLRSRLKRLSQLGEVRFRTVVGKDEAGAALDRLVCLHARRWRGQRTSTILSSSARGRAFYAEACRRYAGRGLIELTMLDLGGLPAAGSLGFVERGTYYHYLPAWEPSLAAFAPATLLLAHLIEQAYARGLRRFDFMLGDEPYKAQWATRSRQTVRLVVGNHGSRGRAAFQLVVGTHRLRRRARASPFLQRARRYGLTQAVRGQLSAISRRETS